MAKIKVNGNYKVIRTPNGKNSSGGVGTRAQDDRSNVEVTVTQHRRDNADGELFSCRILNVSDDLRDQGIEPGFFYNYFGYELTNIICTKEDINGEIDDLKLKQQELENEIEDLQEKYDWMVSNNIKDFDEDEYKIYKTSLLLENGTISKGDKMKEINKIWESQ